MNSIYNHRGIGFSVFPTGAGDELYISLPVAGENTSIPFCFTSLDTLGDCLEKNVCYLLQQQEHRRNSLRELNEDSHIVYKGLTFDVSGCAEKTVVRLLSPDGAEVMSVVPMVISNGTDLLSKFDLLIDRLQKNEALFGSFLSSVIDE